MNYQTAAIVGGVAYLLSAVAGLIGGVPLFDVLLRAGFWAAVGFGGALGVEAVMRNLMPDLFQRSEVAEEGEPDRRVNIVLEDERPATVFEEVDDEPLPAEVRSARPAPVPESPESPARPAVPDAEAPVAAEPGTEEEMPEIGAFLDAFKPSAPAEGDEGGEAPEPADYGSPEPSSRSSGSVSMDGEQQDPVILAKAIQTVMKRDGQGT